MLYFIIIISIIILDQWTKYLANIHLKPIDTYPLIKDIFHLTFRKNTGAAFSILRNKQGFLIIVTLLVVIFLIFYLAKILKNSNLLLLKLPLAFIIGGAIGNLIDRIRLSYVIDFFDFTLINFAVFNVADVFIVVGSILFAYAVIFKNVEI
ncbi:signal peptidase II [Paramaledivibacter caminithermalis]|jgi:signal peptidase II|uniref:Lipoprotein signal peptidase n=1 Tax=Paramaledivibacter caminithermalis (strain DSM 15212 / CIP 107654 / DViRD3) TaxID=1121301 RepID=A0A1M6QLU2_PARC5|nr:signal peptidase II [Paramaledivibacter caminithermalis]SHK21148.1 signal peptidase II [Paramaledivibacter caminithermalis DSM 15212]